MPAKKPTAPILITADEWQLVRRALAFSRDVSENAARLVEEATGVFDRLSILEGMVVEWFEGATREIKELGRQIDRIERLLLLERMNQAQSDEAESIRGKIKNEQSEKILKELLLAETENLQKYRIREAKYGGEAPIYLLNLIEETERKIDRVRSELQLLREGEEGRGLETPDPPLTQPRRGTS